MTIIAIIIGGLIAGHFAIFSAHTIYLAIIAAFLITGAGNAINDYFDCEADKINRSKRPIPAGKISKKGALGYSILLFIVGIALAGLINFVTLIIALVNTVVLVAYSSHLQNKIFVGNLAIGYLVASTFLFGWASYGQAIHILPIIILMILAGLATLSREIVKDLEDMEGDRKSFLKRLRGKTKAIGDRFRISKGKAKYKISIKKYKAVAVMALLIAIFFSPAPYLTGVFGLGYLFLLTIADLVFIICIYMIIKAANSKHYGRISKYIKIGMNIGLLAFIAGVLI